MRKVSSYSLGTLVLLASCLAQLILSPSRAPTARATDLASTAPPALSRNESGFDLMGCLCSLPVWVLDLVPESATVVEVKELKKAEETGKGLDEKIVDLMPRLNARRAVAADLAQNRISLLDAAVQFKALDQEQPTVDPSLTQQRFEGKTEAERYCRRVIEFAAYDTASGPGPNKDLTARLQAELAKELERGDLAWPE